jgi:hypothetical protein
VLGSGALGGGQLFVWSVPPLESASKAAGVSSEERRQAREDIHDVLAAHAVDASVDVFVRVRGEGKDGYQDDVETARRKYELVAELFDVERLRQSSWTKFTSKTPNFFRVDWEVGTKLSDDDYPRPSGPPEPYAVVQLRVSSRRGTDVDESSLTFAMDAVDLQVLQHTLARLQDALSAEDTLEAGR